MKNPSSALEYKYTTASLGSLKIDISFLCQVNVIVKLVGSLGLLAVTRVMGRTHLNFKVMCVCIHVKSRWYLLQTIVLWDWLSSLILNSSVLLEIKFDRKYLKMLVFSCKPKIQFFIFQALKIFLDTAEAEVRSLISLYSEVVSLNFCLVIR